MSLDTSGWDDVPVWANHRSFFSFNPSERITAEQGSANRVMLTDFCLWFFIHSIAATSSFFFSAPVHTTRNRKTAYLPELNSQTLPNYLRLHLHSYSEDIIERSSCTKSHFVSPKIIWIGKYSRESRTGCSFFFWKRCPVAPFLGRPLAKRAPFCGMTSCARSDVWCCRAQVNVFTRHKRWKVLGNVTKWNMGTFEGVLYQDSVCVYICTVCTYKRVNASKIFIHFLPRPLEAQ